MRRSPRAAPLARGVPGVRGPGSVPHRHPDNGGGTGPFAAPDPPRGLREPRGLAPAAEQQRAHGGAGAAAVAAVAGAPPELRRGAAALPLGSGGGQRRGRASGGGAQGGGGDARGALRCRALWQRQRGAAPQRGPGCAGGAAGGQRTSIPPFSIRALLPPRLDLYYRYNGSLTTPPCFQSVLWTLLREPVRISQAQLEQLQGTLYSTEASEAEPQLLEGNFRGPQELNQRRVLASSPKAPEGYSTGEGIAIIIGALGSCIGLFLSIHLVGKRMRSMRRTQEQDIVFKASSRRGPPNHSHP
ncbi:carbonic anhydrase 14 isoform X3 [Lathamus discolor]|uniref:carbonic anhydrase 14 isoform X3 n=1 Tax=Lathamus discolor TaxID=678569 RepID=UPI0032B79653